MPITSASSGTKAAAHLALSACVALIVLGLAWECWWAPIGRGTLALKVLPLAAALPGLWQRRLYTYRWLSLALWLYVAEGAVRAFGDHGTAALLASVEVLLALLLFAGCAWHVRARLAEQRGTPAPSPA